MYTDFMCSREDAFDEALDLCGRGDADRVSEDDLVRLELRTEIGHVSRVDVSLEGAAERDADSRGRRQLGDADDRHRLGERLVEGHGPVALVERLGRSERAVDTSELRLAQPLVALHVQHQACELRPLAVLDPRGDLFGAGHLRNAVVAHERHRLDSRQSRRRKSVDEVRAHGRREHVRLVLQPVARADVAEGDLHQPPAPNPSTISGWILMITRCSPGPR